MPGRLMLAAFPREGAADVDLVRREPSLGVSPDVSLVASMRLDQFTLLCHVQCSLPYASGDARGSDPHSRVRYGK